MMVAEMEEAADVEVIVTIPKKATRKGVYNRCQDVGLLVTEARCLLATVVRVCLAVPRKWISFLESVGTAWMDQQVMSGIAFLDLTYSPEWRSRVDWNVLDISSDKNCILGQLEGSFRAGRAKHHLTMRASVLYGFSPVAIFWLQGADQRARRYAELTRVWRHQAMPQSLGI